MVKAGKYFARALVLGGLLIGGCSVDNFGANLEARLDSLRNSIEGHPHVSCAGGFCHHDIGFRWEKIDNEKPFSYDFGYGKRVPNGDNLKVVEY